MTFTDAETDFKLNIMIIAAQEQKERQANDAPEQKSIHGRNQSPAKIALDVNPGSLDVQRVQLARFVQQHLGTTSINALGGGGTQTHSL